MREDRFVVQLTLGWRATEDMTSIDEIQKQIDMTKYAAKNNVHAHLTFAMASFGQTPSLRHRPFTILVVPIPGNRIKHTPPIHGNATPTLVIQLR